ncbi:MAG: alpha/beta hydrolase [Nitrospirota bacterium]
MNVKSTLTGLFIFFVLGYLLILIFLYLRQASLLYYPTKELLQTPKDIGLDFEELALKTTDGINISAWYIPAKDERGAILMCNGNAGNISYRIDLIQIFNNLNLSILIFDYRGFGKSEGKPTEEGTYLDAEAALDYLVNIRHYPTAKIILYGQSLGGAIAAEMALRHNAAAIIIESSFKSVPELGSKFFPFIPVKLISCFHYATIEKIDKINCPKLIIHSPDDEIVPYSHGVALFEKAREPKEFLKIKGDHNEGFLLSGMIYIDGLNRFISKYF